MKKRIVALGTLVLAAAAWQSLAQPGSGPGGGMGVIHMDQDGDGRISREEFRPPEEPRGHGGFLRADSDGDGAVTLAEVEAAMQERIDRMRERMTAGFTAMDSDGDGRVTRDEMAEHAFSRLDADGDGYITEQEARDRHRQRGKGRPGAPDDWSED